jgi:phosphoribosylamine--glycine ligase
VIAAAEGYPGVVRSGDAIGIQLSDEPRRQLFHSGTRRDAEGVCRTAGGRVLAMVAQAEDFDAAFDRAYAGLGQVQYEGITFRRDIGHQVRSRNLPLGPETTR